jgi:hypothetical protein
MDLLKYIIVGAGVLLISIILAFVVRNIIAGIGFFILSIGAYILWNYFDSARKDTSTENQLPQSTPTPPQPPAQDN